MNALRCWGSGRDFPGDAPLITLRNGGCVAIARVTGACLSKCSPRTGEWRSVCTAAKPSLRPATLRRTRPVPIATILCGSCTARLWRLPRHGHAYVAATCRGRSTPQCLADSATRATRWNLPRPRGMLQLGAVSRAAGQWAPVAKAVWRTPYLENAARRKDVS